MIVALLFVVLLGLAIGSFLNVVIWRVPRGESIVTPESACPRCGHPIRRRDNVPVLSWLLLRGRCRDCGERIALRYPVVEALTGILFAAAAWHWGITWSLPAYLYLASIALALTLIDLDSRRLPDAIVLPSYPVVIALLAVASWAPGVSSDWLALERALIGGLALFGLYFLLMVAYPAGTGFGDVKLAGVLGLYLGWVGWGSLVVGWFAAYLFGGLFSIGLMLAGRAARKTRIPFGPWMFLGAAVGVVWGGQITDWYLSFL
ncbi:type 4 prepilin-like protein leader peptide-processing enzyme [mine drainage metagenome]|uniref:Type 4 prepilin-like protein leader peptide-processing enzyme n=1 Tax=mine drainage metagenome TaxID=410659 RepID=A0A1J5QQ35_9ZZZZ